MWGQQGMRRMVRRMVHLLLTWWGCCYDAAVGDGGLAVDCRRTSSRLARSRRACDDDVAVVTVYTLTNNPLWHNPL